MAIAFVAFGRAIEANATGADRQVGRACGAGGRNDAVFGVKGKRLVGLERDGRDQALEVDADPSVGQRLANRTSADFPKGANGKVGVVEKPIQRDQIGPGRRARAGGIGRRSARRGHQPSDLAQKGGVAGGMAQIAVAGNPAEPTVTIPGAVHVGRHHRTVLLAATAD